MRPFLKILIGLTLSFFTMNAQVQYSGAMKNVMKKGELFGTIHLDTIVNKNNLYGIGPVEYLKGELTIIDGRSFVSYVTDDNRIKVEETYDIKAPFFVYANNDSWQTFKLPSHVNTMKALESYIDSLTLNTQRPFVFLLKGTFEMVDFHIQNLPDGTVVKSHEDAHQNQGKYVRYNVNGDIVGFFSTEHKGIFTHHDTYMHMHFINEAKDEMGHIDDITFDPTQEKFLLLPLVK